MAAPARAEDNTDYAACSDAGIDSLQKWYNTDTGQWTTTGWWNAANAVTVLVRYTRVSGSNKVSAAIGNTFERASGANFLNSYYDDEGWWALAWLDAWEETHDARYLNMAKTIFTDMSGGWDQTCGGGIWWSKERKYKNAIANELFLSVAARLATDAQSAKDRAAALVWAKKEWQWFAASGMINADNLVNDGLNDSCQNNGANTWSYNQGVILGGLSALAAETRDKLLTERARTIAHAAITHLTDKNGILHDTCEPNCGDDGVQFKGIFTRNLATLNAASPATEYSDFLRANATSICNNQTASHTFGVVWSGPSTAINAATQVSALDAVLAAEGLRPR